MTLANRITLLRFLLVPFFGGALAAFGPGREAFLRIAAALFVLAMVTDALDGIVARARSEESPLGIFLDPLADKCLLLSGFVLLAFLPALPERVRIPSWLTLLVVGRDLLILAGSGALYGVTRRLGKPSRLGKLTTFCQMATVCATLFGVPGRLPLYGLTAGVTVLSGLGYLRYGIRLLNGARSTP